MKRIFLVGGCFVLLAVLSASGFFFQRQTIAIHILPKSFIYHSTYGSPQQFMEGIYAANNAVQPSAEKHVRGLIVPHHLVASESIAAGIKMLQGQSVKKILLLSPDHFGRCRTMFCTMNATYETELGATHATTGTVVELLASPLVSENEELFKREHGIFVVVPFIAHYLPGVEVTPLVLSLDSSWRASEREILNLFDRVVDEDTILVVSSDFSHYLPFKTSEEMDIKTLASLRGKNLEDIASLQNPDQSDCPGCLLTIASLAKERGFYDLSVVKHTNSAILLHDESIQITTSHFSLVWYEEKK